jgi:hypothetical protein
VGGTSGDLLGGTEEGRAVGGVMGAPRNAELRRKLVAAGWGKTVP